MTANLTVCARQVLSTQDLKVRPERDVTEIVGHFLSTAEAVVAHWVEYSKGLLLFVMVPGDARSGEFYVYDRKKGTFWLLSLADSVFGGYSLADMRQKIKDFRLLDFAEDPSRLPASLVVQIRILRYLRMFHRAGSRNAVLRKLYGEISVTGNRPFAFQNCGPAERLKCFITQNQSPPSDCAGHSYT